ncbi:MAG: TIGR03986 family CRISPR-associated RAMP protein [Lachnospiraceae bacterium]
MSKNRERFLNPYYFISLPEQKQEATEEEEKLTGKITYTITTQTPIFIPNTSCDEAFDIKIPEKENSKDGKHKSYDFYSYAELEKGEAEISVKEPIIPGSEVRGMLRSVYEAVTGSCMSIINDEAMISNRTDPGRAFKPHLLVRREKTIYLEQANITYMEKELAEELQDGKKYFFKSYSKEIEVGHRRRIKRYFVDGTPSLKQMKDKKKFGYLMRGEIEPKGTESTTKKYVVLFSKKNGEQEEIIFDETLQNQMENILSIYEADSNSYIEYAKRYREFLDGDGEEYFPIYARKLWFYEEVDGEGKYMIQVSPAAISKQVYKKKVRNLINEKLKPCTSLKDICPACSLFGMVNSKGKKEKGVLKSKASKIRFSDLTLENRNVDFSTLFCKRITIEELASPKISNAQMYLSTPMDVAPALEVKDWNYDYWVDQYGKIHDYEAKINGRKFYWHHPEFMLHEAEVTKRNVTIRPLREKKSFIGNIFFDGITKKQLEQIVYLCDISGTEEYGYKIGMGKPLGMGSILMKVSSITFRKFDINKDELYVEDKIDFKKEEERNKYLNQYRYGYTDVGFLDGKIQQDFEMIMKFSKANNETISYPYTLEQVDEEIMSEGFQWFVANKHNSNKNLQILKGKQEENDLPFLRVLRQIR